LPTKFSVAMRYKSRILLKGFLGPTFGDERANDSYSHLKMWGISRGQGRRTKGKERQKKTKKTEILATKVGRRRKARCITFCRQQKQQSRKSRSKRLKGSTENRRTTLSPN